MTGRLSLQTLELLPCYQQCGMVQVSPSSTLVVIHETKYVLEAAVGA